MKYYTSDELATLRKSRAAGVPYVLIAERLGRSAGALKTVFSKPPRVAADILNAAREALIERVADGERIVDIARELGKQPHTICTILSNAGFDGEMRALARANRPAMQIGRTG